MENELNQTEVSKKNNKLPIIVVLIIGICLMVTSIVMLVLNGGNNSEEKKDNTPAEVKLSDEEKTKLLALIPEATPFSKDKEYSAYGEKKIEVKDMDANWLVYKAMQNVKEKGTCTEELFNLNGICDFTLKVTDVEKAFKDMYGDVKVTYPDVVQDNFLWKCTKKEDLYACSNSGGGYISNAVIDYFGVRGTRSYAKIEKAVKDEKTLTLTVTYARFEFVYDESNDDLQPGDITFRILKFGSGDALVDETILNGKDYYKTDKTFTEQIYNEYKEKLAQYKVTYTIDGSNYLLTSVEPV